ncbi:unnamed protein product, partial [Rotaria sp. Silwood1]
MFQQKEQYKYANSISSDIYTNLSCDTYMQCDGAFSACLDWREICDGKVDCTDGDIDEQHCDRLEVNECKENEYRCHNGQCIPEEFWRDGTANPECLDGTDEIMGYLYPLLCYGDPAFRCED